SSLNTKAAPAVAEDSSRQGPSMTGATVAGGGGAVAARSQEAQWGASSAAIGRAGLGVMRTVCRFRAAGSPVGVERGTAFGFYVRPATRRRAHALRHSRLPRGTYRPVLVAGRGRGADGRAPRRSRRPRG